MICDNTWEDAGKTTDQLVVTLFTISELLRKRGFHLLEKVKIISSRGLHIFVK